MDIIKSILHVFKKSDNAFKVMHPETESACITDWNTGIVNTLASTGLSSIVNVLSSDSLIALLIKKVFDATGVKYSLGKNGYVCWGSLFGGVITQWVSYSDVPRTGVAKIITFPIVMSNVFAVASSVDTPGAILQTGNVTGKSLEWSITGTGYESSTARSIIIGK